MNVDKQIVMYIVHTVLCINYDSQVPAVQAQAVH